MGLRFVTVAALIAASTALAHAQSATAQAEVLFREGRELLAAGKTAEACNAFAESQKVEPVTTTLLNLAACREKQGQIATAWGLFVDAARQTRSARDAATKKMHAVASEHASKLEGRISKLTINVPQPSQIDGLELSRDGAPLDALMWNHALPIDGGTYTISAHAPGTTTWTTQITVAAERDTKTIDIPALPALPRDIVRAPAPPVALGHAAPSVTRPSRVAPIAMTAGALALIGGGVGLEVWASSAYADAKAERTSQARRNSLERSANHRRYAAEGLGGAGIAATGVAVWLWLRDRGERTETEAIARHLVVSPTGVAVIGGF